MRRFKVGLSWLFVFLWMALIFFFSSQIGSVSGSLSEGITDFIFNIIRKVTPNINLNIVEFHTFLRKTTHFIIYFILGILLSNSLRLSGVKGKKIIFFAITISILYAISDEVHQLFVPERGGSVKDVFIDTMGSLLGAFIYFKLFKYIDKKRSKKVDFNINEVKLGLEKKLKP